MKKYLIFLPSLLLVGQLKAQKPQLKVQAGHMSFVSGLTFSPSGEHILSVALDGNIKIWETASGREIKNISAGQVIYDFELNSDGKAAWTSDISGNITGWNLNTGLAFSQGQIKSMMAMHLGFMSTSQVYRPIALIGNNLAVANEGDAMANILKLDKLIGSITIYDSNSGKENVGFKQNDAAISAIAFANEQKLVTGDKNNNIKIWDAVKGKEIKNISSGQNSIFSISANDKYIVSGGSSGSIKVWDLSTGQNIYTLNGHSSDITDLKISKHGNTLVSNDKSSTKVWDLSKGTEIFDNKVENISNGFANSNNVVAISNDNSLYASSWFGSVNIYDRQSNRFLKRLEGNDSGLIGNLFFPGTTNPGMIYQGADRIIAKGWDYPNAVSKTLKVNVSGKAVLVHPRLESVIVYSPGAQNEISVLNFETGKEQCKLSGHTKVIHRAIYNHDGTKIITGSQDNSVRVWDSKTGKELNKLTRRGFASTGFNGGIFIGKDDKTILTQGLKTYATTPTPTQVWNLETGRAINLTGIYFNGTPVISPDGKMIAGTGAVMSKKESISQLMIFDTTTGKQIGSFKGNPGSMYMSFSADSKCIALTMPDGVDLIDIATEEVKYKLPHLAVNHYAFSEDGSLIMTYGIDVMSRLWDYDTGEEIAALISYRDNENTIVLPNRYYYSTKGAIGGIHYVMGGKAIPFDQFDLQYNRPDIVFEKLGVTDKSLINGYKKAYEKRLSKNGVTENMFSEEIHLPNISVDRTNIPITTATKLLKVNFTAKDDKYALSKIIVSVNNIPIHGNKGLDVRATSRAFSNELEIELSEGRNKIGIIAVNEKGSKSIEEVVEVQYTGEAPKPNLYILAIGVSEYSSPEMNLTYAAKDAWDLVSAFQSQSGNYGNITVLKYLNQDATVSNILQSKEILQKTKVDDEVVVFVAGHGLLDQNLDYYLATYDVDFLNPSAKGLKYEDLEGLLDGIPARKKIMLLDACHSGEVDKEAGGEQTASTISTTGNVKFRGFNSSANTSLGLQNSFKMMQELFADLRRGTGAVVISSASGAEYAFESPEWNNGVFTYALLEGLKSGKCDENKDGEIRISEIRNYVMNKVVDLTNGAQHPTARNENLEFDFSIW